MCTILVRVVLFVALQAVVFIGLTWTAIGLRTGVWAPGILRFVFMALRHTPGPVWRRLPLG